MQFDAHDLGILTGAWKAVPAGARGSSAADLVAARPALSRMPTPLLTLDAGALAHNLATMARWTRRAGVDLAPHGKTSMAPTLWHHQLDAGAWGISVATPWQLTVALDAGVPVVLAAYPVLEPDVLRLLARPREQRVLALADGVDVVAAMAPHVADAATPLDVVVELGAPRGRTGARGADAALRVADAVSATPGLRLAGVGGYEGALAHDTAPASLAVVRDYLEQVRRLHEHLLAAGSYGDVPGGIVVTAGGSAYFDLVADVLAPLHDPAGERGPAVRTVVRSGAYVAHDDGFYRGITPLARTRGDDSFRAALHGWVRVVSRPEPGLALADGGKRDLPFDEGLPEVQAVRRGGTGATEALAGATVTAVNDQHAFVHLAEGTDVAVGDVLRLGISHPCTAFDKWQVVPVVDDAHAAQPVVTDLLRTVFG